MSEEKKIHVAVVDRDPSWAETMVQFLEMSGMTAVAFFAQSNTQELTGKINEQTPDLVITGAIMDGESNPTAGLEMAENLQQLGYPVLFASDPHFQKAIEAQGFQFLDKAEVANVQAFLAIIREILES